MSTQEVSAWSRVTTVRPLPPGQRAVAGFPRFGKRLQDPPPAIPENPALVVSGPLTERITLTPGDLEALPRVEQEEDFHCVAGWSATGLLWAGVRFGDLYRALIQGRLRSGVEISHLTFRGADGYQSIVELADALEEDVLLATELNGRPLTPAHGAPLRLVSPRQYGFISTKHLCSIELHTHRPRSDQPYGVLIREHPRARVWQEERHAWFPAPVIRPLYRGVMRLLIRLSARPPR